MTPILFFFVFFFNRLLFLLYWTLDATRGSCVVNGKEEIPFKIDKIQFHLFTNFEF